MDPRQESASGKCEQRHIGGTRYSAVRWLAAAVLVLSLVGATGYLGWMRFQRYQSDIAAAQALDAAEKYAFKLADLDADMIEQHLADAHDGSTGEFHVRHVRATDRLRQLVLDNQVIARGTVVESAVKSATPTKVVVVVLVDQAVTNVDHPDPQIDRSRIRMTMEKVDGRWLASRVELA
jgi:Mce-associated membrane protein